MSDIYIYITYKINPLSEELFSFPLVLFCVTLFEKSEYCEGIIEMFCTNLGWVRWKSATLTVLFLNWYVYKIRLYCCSGSKLSRNNLYNTAWHSIRLIVCSISNFYHTVIRQWVHSYMSSYLRNIWYAFFLFTKPSVTAAELLRHTYILSCTYHR